MMLLRCGIHGLSESGFSSVLAKYLPKSQFPSTTFLSRVLIAIGGLDFSYINKKHIIYLKSSVGRIATELESEVFS